MAPSGWPLLRHLFDLGYVVVVRYRVPLGRPLGRRRCDDACAIR